MSATEGGDRPLGGQEQASLEQRITALETQVNVLQMVLSQWTPFLEALAKANPDLT